MTTMDDFGDDDTGASQDEPNDRVGEPTGEDPDETIDVAADGVECTRRDGPAEDVTYRISEDANRVNLMTKIKRGSGTRDQDVVKVKVAGDDPEATAQRLNDVLVELVDVPQELRDIQPE